MSSGSHQAPPSRGFPPGPTAVIACVGAVLPAFARCKDAVDDEEMPYRIEAEARYSIIAYQYRAEVSRSKPPPESSQQHHTHDASKKWFRIAVI